MTIEKKREGANLTLILDGWLDTETSPMLAAEIDALDEGVTSLVIDCSALAYISSAGLRQVVAAHKKMNGALTLLHVSDEIMNIIKMTGLNKKLHIEA